MQASLDDFEKFLHDRDSLPVLVRGAAMRTTIVSFLLVVISIAVSQPTWAQRVERSGRAARFNAKPGEVITPPDRSLRWPDRLQVGDKAPDFTLPLAIGVGDALAIVEHEKRGATPKPGEAKLKSRPEVAPIVSLRQLHAAKPAVLIFGSVTCPPFRSQLEGIDDVYHDFNDRANFLFVYIREAHPDSVLALVDDKRAPALVKIPQAATAEERTSAAVACQQALKLSMPIAVDSIDNTVGRAYAGWPNRMVVVGTDGRILYASPGSPRGTDARRLRDWLEENL
jgi:hypothetical protein